MTLNQLRTFLAVAETGSVRAAAQDLVVTQAAVSASLTALQKSLGVVLLEPDGRGLRLTAAGQAYSGYVRRILGLLDEAGRAAAAAADPERGELRIAAVTTAAEQILPGLLSGFRTRYPRLGVRLEAGNRDRVRGLLDRHQVDLVLGGRPEPGWDVEVLAERPHELVVVAAPSLAAGAREAAPGTGPRPDETGPGRNRGGRDRPGRDRRGRQPPAAVAGPPGLAAARAGLGHPGSHRRAADRAGHRPAHPDGGLQRRDPRVGERGPGGHPDLPRRGRRRIGRWPPRPAPGPRHPHAPRLVPGGPGGPPGRAAPGSGPPGRPRHRARRLPAARARRFHEEPGRRPGARRAARPTIKEMLENQRGTLNRQSMGDAAGWQRRTPPPTHRRNP